MRQKRIMILGGNIVQMEAIKEAKRFGYYVISADLHADNPGHKFSDEYCRVDIIDRDAVLKEAKRLKIDGIIPYCSDALAPVAAYVAEQMGLPGNPYKSVMTLCRKDLFRKFLVENGFPCPFYGCFSSMEEAVTFFEKRKEACVMKPVDSNSCCGVFKIESREDIIRHWRETAGYSSSQKVIIEQYIERIGFQQDGDVFLVDGKIIFDGRCDQYKAASNPFVPISLSYPSMLDVSVKRKAMEMLQSIFIKLCMNSGPFNVEYVVGKDGSIYFLDIGPRNGGWKFPFFVDKAAGFNELEYTMRIAVGDNLISYGKDLYEDMGNWRMLFCIVYAVGVGKLKDLWISDYYKHTVFDITMLKGRGDTVGPSPNGRGAVAVICSQFFNHSEMLEAINNIGMHLRVITE